MMCYYIILYCHFSKLSKVASSIILIVYIYIIWILSLSHLLYTCHILIYTKIYVTVENSLHILMYTWYTYIYIYVCMYIYSILIYEPSQKMSGMFDVSIRHEVIQRDDLVRAITSDDVSWCFLLLQPLATARSTVALGLPRSLCVIPLAHIFIAAFASRSLLLCFVLLQAVAIAGSTRTRRLM